jgi:hypothetical protein
MTGADVWEVTYRGHTTTPRVVVVEGTSFDEVVSMARIAADMMYPERTHIDYASLAISNITYVGRVFVDERVVANATLRAA